MQLSRRTLLRLSAIAGTLAATGLRAGPTSVEAASPVAQDFGAVIAEAETLSRAPYVEPKPSLPANLAELTYDQYRDIRFNRDKALWKGEERGFEVDLFHPGFRFQVPVQFIVVGDGTARPLAFSTDMFNYGPSVVPPAEPANLFYSGFRVRHPLNDAKTMDEFAVFQGASYFRAVAKGQRYGMSARGLAINTAGQEGEEFPYFRKFWLIRPQAGSASLVVLALLDSPSTTGAYRFTLRPGNDTVIDVELVLFPRVALDKVGFAPLTSMFLFDPSSGVSPDDYRNAVHDSDGLQILTGSGERIIRPLANPARLQVSAFVDRNPRGFGLVQRARKFDDFKDLETRYELRPSAWVEPIGDWGGGAVVLVEIPTDTETNENIVAYWRPSEPIQPNRPFNLTYRLHWANSPPDATGGAIARAVSTRSGLSFDRQRRLFVVEFAGVPAEVGTPTPDVAASKGRVVNVVGRQNPVIGTFRVSFELDTGREELIELRLGLVAGGKPVSETWLYRWTRR